MQYYRKGLRYYRGALRYYRMRDRSQTGPDVLKQRAVEPPEWYYRSPLRYYRKAGFV